MMPTNHASAVRAGLSSDKPGLVLDRHTEQSQHTRAALVEAALVEFSRHGFDGASTRAIATRAGCHQPQINYHFDSKEALWEAAVDHLFGELAEAMGDIADIGDPSERFATLLRRFVGFAARRPELNRIMVAEAMTPGARLSWVVERYSRGAHAQMLVTWRAVRAAGHGADIDERLLYHLSIGAASLLWANAPEAQLLDPTIDASDDTITAHGDALVTLFLPKYKPRTRKQSHDLPPRQHRRPSRARQ
jgi:TetR/AcrR family transcriptional regulator